MKVIYCLHSLAELCHTRRLAPFFTGATRAVRKKKREMWKREAPNTSGPTSFLNIPSTPSVTSSKDDFSGGNDFSNHDSDDGRGVGRIGSLQRKLVYDSGSDNEVPLRRRGVSSASSSKRSEGSHHLPQLVPVVAVTTTTILSDQERSIPAPEPPKPKPTPTPTRTVTRRPESPARPPSRFDNNFAI